MQLASIHRRSDTLRLSDYNGTHLWRDRQGAEGDTISQAKGQSKQDTKTVLSFVHAFSGVNYL
jgi:hypothetical protein